MAVLENQEEEGGVLSEQSRSDHGNFVGHARTMVLF